MSATDELHKQLVITQRKLLEEECNHLQCELALMNVTVEMFKYKAPGIEARIVEIQKLLQIAAPIPPHATVVPLNKGPQNVGNV